LGARFYGLVDAAALEAFELYLTEGEAERRRWQLIQEAPERETLLVVEPIELDQSGEPCWN
jgi:hypothetical protein